MTSPPRVIFVCRGNICRSPMAAVVFNSLYPTFSDKQFRVDSAGTSDWHLGEDMDRRARTELARRGYPPTAHSARTIQSADSYARAVVALDESTKERLLRRRFHPSRLLSLGYYDPLDRDPSVTDPYLGDDKDFASALDRIERSIEALCNKINKIN